MKNLSKTFFVLLAALMLSACTQSVSVSATQPPTLPPVSATPLPTPASTPVPSQPLEPREDDYPDVVLDGVATEADVLPMHTSFKDAYAANGEVLGWVKVPGTNIDYPVARTDDNKYYLKHNVDKQKSKYGCVFMDYRNADPEQQSHIVLYGHNMKNGTMFHELNNYKQRDFFDANRYIYFYWDGVDTVWQIFCAYTVRIDQVQPNLTRFGSAENFADCMNDYMEYARSVSPSNVADGVTIHPNDQVITLLTCTYEYDDSRFCVMGRRVK